MPDFNYWGTNKTLNTWALITALSASICLLVWAGSWTVANVLKARGVSALYVVKQSPNDELERQHGMDLLATAQSLNPFNREYPFYQAYFLDLHISAMPGEPERPATHSPLKSRDHVYAFYREALEIKPHSGHLWAQYANSLYKNNGRAEDVLSALDKAVTFAPYQLAVLLPEIQIGLRYWSRLSEKQELQLRSSIDYLLHHNPGLVINTALANNLVEPLRPLLKREDYIKRLDHAVAENKKDNTGKL